MKYFNHKILFIILLFWGTNVFAQITIQYLVVGGGGGGGSGSDRTSAGGSGGQVLVSSVAINSGSYTVTVGAGGGNSVNGGVSSISGTGITTVNAVGGGRGGYRGGTSLTAPSNSAYSGGTHHYSSGTTNGSVANRGGAGYDGGGSGPWASGGGGGAGGAGGTGSGSSGGAGGSGLSNTYRSNSGVIYGAGGKGGFQTGAGSNTSGSVGGNNTGNGGGGGAASTTVIGQSGGSGIVVIRYASSLDLASGGTETFYNSGGIDYRVHTFTTGGTFTYTGVISLHPSVGAQNICINGSSVALSVTATGSTIQYQWYSNSSNSNSGGTLITDAQSASYTPPTNVAGTKYYYCYVTNSTSNQTSNVSGAININTPSVSGNISGSNTVTSGTNSTNLTLSGHTGSVQWQSYTGSNAYGNASGTSTNSTYTASNLNATTYYRAVVTNGGCASVTTSSVTILVLPSTTPSSTTLSVSGTGGTITMANNLATVVDNLITVSSNGAISGFTVSISENYSSGDVLGYTGSLPSGVSSSGFNVSSRSIVFKGNASAANWQTFLRTVTLKSTSATCNPEKRKITFTVSTNFYNYFNGHYYEYVSSGRIWSSAKANAESKTFFGRQGYLATISSAEENAYISKLIGQNSWLGATDNFKEINKAVGYSKYSSQSQSEGKYHWVTGPEKGVQISNGSSSIPGRYLRWAGGEPNNYNTGFKDKSLNLFGEHYLHIYSSSSTWNDFPDDRSLGSIIEYGDMPGDIPVTGIDYTRDVTITGMTGGSISGGLGTVCSGGNASLTLTGAAGSVARWESSDDNFLSNTQTLSNTTTTLNVTNILEKTFYRAVMVNGGCTLATPSTHINVLELNGGVVSSESNEGCSGSAINLTLGGNKGIVSKWQITSNPVGTITDIASTSTSLSHTINSAGSYYMRAVVGNISCSNSEESDWYPVEIVSGVPPIAGEVSSAAHCGSANNGVLTLKDSKGGSTYLWQKSTDGGSVWSSAGSTTTRLTYNNIGQNTLFRVQVSKGSCGSATSSIGEIVIYGTSISQWIGGGTDANWSTAPNWCGEVVGTTGRRVAVSEDALSDPMLDGHLAIAELNFNASGRKVILGYYDLSVDNILGADSLNYFKTNDTGSLIQSINTSDSFMFAVGLSNYNPVKITNRTGSADQFSVYVFDEVYEGGNKGSGNAKINTPRVQCTWEIGKANANSGSGIDFTFEWESHKKKGGAIINPTVNHYSKSKGDWEFASNTTQERRINSITLKGYTGTFSPFAIGDGMTPLPVNIISFKAEAKVNTVQLNWVAESEINHSHFVVMRSKDGVEWEEIGVVSDNKGSQDLTQYELIDPKPYSDNYYQLKVVDIEGNSELSDIRFVQLSIAKPLFVLSPNPTSGIVKIQTESSIADYFVTDISGKVLQQGHLNKEIKLESLSSGIYFIKVIVDDRIDVKKLIVE